MSFFSIKTLEDKVSEAMQFLQDHEPSEGYYLGDSGGKDSIVTLDIANVSGVKYQAFYCNTLIDPPEVVRFVKKHHPDTTILKPNMTFWQGMLKKGLPLSQSRWCCDVLKKDPAKHIELNHRIMGVRAEESSKRAARGKLIKHDKLKDVWIYHPIFEFTEGDIWEYIESRKLPYPSLYDEGFSRLGCVVCPYLGPPSSAKYQMHKKRWPGMYRILDKYLRLFYEQKKELIIDRKCPVCDGSTEEKYCNFCADEGIIKIRFGDLYTLDDILNWPDWLTGDEARERLLQTKLF